MQIVIDIPEDFMENIDELNNKFDAIKEAFYGSMAIMAIQSGKPLPKGHGRLIDADAVDTRYSDPEVVETLDDAPTIIEADEESENNE